MITSLLTILILYTGDSNLLSYFADGFTERLSSEHRFHVYEDKSILTTWLMNASQTPSEKQTESKIDELIKNLKTQQISAQTALDDFHNILTSGYVKVPQSRLGAFYFWCLARSIQDDPSKINECFSGYEKYALVIEKDDLQSQVSKSTLEKIRQIFIKTKIMQTKIHISKTKDCLVAVNGQTVSTEDLFLPTLLSSTLTAKCNSGFFETQFTPKKIKQIKIEPISPRPLNMLNISDAPQSMILQNKIDLIVLVHWSQQHNFMQAQMVNARLFVPIKSMHLDFKNEYDFDRAGDTLANFINSAR